MGESLEGSLWISLVLRGKGNLGEGFQRHSSFTYVVKVSSTCPCSTLCDLQCFPRLVPLNSLLSRLSLSSFVLISSPTPIYSCEDCMGR